MENLPGEPCGKIGGKVQKAVEGLLSCERRKEAEIAGALRGRPEIPALQERLPSAVHQRRPEGSACAVSLEIPKRQTGLGAAGSQMPRRRDRRILCHDIRSLATDGNRDHGASLLFQCFEILHGEDVVWCCQQCGKPGVSGELCHGEASGRRVGFTLLQIGLQQGLPYCWIFLLRISAAFCR